MLPLSLPQDPAAPLKLLCLGAHADDIEIGCGGTILQLLAARPNTEVTWVVFSSAGVREREALAGASLFLEQAARQKIKVMKFRDGFFPYEGAKIKEFFEELKNEGDPDLIFTHYRDDRHQDHRTISDLTWNTWRRHLILEYEIPKWDGDLGRPNVFIPATRAVMERKVELLLEHFGSQRSKDWFDPQTFTGLARLRGIECRAPDGLAEAFHVRKLVLQ